jgi:hypothetical protein
VKGKMKICKRHYRELQEEVKVHPELWYSIFGTTGYWIVGEDECEICELERVEGRKVR